MRSFMIILGVAAAAVSALHSAPPEPLTRLHGAIAPVDAVPLAGEFGAVTRSVLLPSELAESRTIVFNLRLRDAAGLQARVERGEVLSITELQERHFPTQQAWQAVSDWARSVGFTVEPPDLTRLAVHGRASVQHTGSALDVKFARVTGSDGREHTSAVTAPAVPERLQAVLLCVSELQPHIQPLPQQSFSIPQMRGTHAIPYILPGALTNHYRTAGNGLDGTGQRIAILGSGNVNVSDLEEFWQRCGLPTTAAQFRQVEFSGYPIGGNELAAEPTMGLQWASAFAPRAELLYLGTISPDRITPWISAEFAAGRPIHQLSTSYGIPESVYTVPDAQRETEMQYFVTLAALGVSVFASSGNDGTHQLVVDGTIPKRGYRSNGTLTVLLPAAFPHVTAVGGTSLGFAQDAQGNAVPPISEGGWTLPIDRLEGSVASTGGFSRFFSRPAWQIGGAMPAGTMRAVPDVAAVANTNLPLYVQYRGLWFGAAGTSLAAPIWAGLAAQINQARSARGLPPLGLLGPRLYPLMGTSAFNQITIGMVGGSTIGASNNNGAYEVGPNYNLVTGLGSPNMEALLAALTVAETPTPTPTAPSASPYNGQKSSPSGGGGAPSAWSSLLLAVLMIGQVRPPFLSAGGPRHKCRPCDPNSRGL